MATNRSGHRPAGGLHSRNVHHVTAPKREPRGRAINPGGVNMLGNHVGDHITHKGAGTGFRGEDLIRGPGYNAPVGPSSFSNIGPGGGRTIYEHGTQCQTGAPAAGSPPPNRQRDALENE
jgi:hypothetical protein